MTNPAARRKLPAIRTGAATQKRYPTQGGCVRRAGTMSPIGHRHIHTLPLFPQRARDNTKIPSREISVMNNRRHKKAYIRKGQKV